MPYAYPRIRALFRGLIQSNQTFSFGFSVSAGSTIPSAADLQTWVNSAGAAPTTALLTATNGPRTFWSADTVLTSLSAYYYTPSQPTAYLQAALALSTNNTGSGTGSLPTQSAICISMRTQSPERRARGRLYIPATGAALTAHQLASANAAGLASAFGAFFTSINALTLSGQATSVIVATQLLDFPFSVNRVIVDSELDVQRRRADKLLPLSTASATVS